MGGLTKKKGFIIFKFCKKVFVSFSTQIYV